MQPLPRIELREKHWMSSLAALFRVPGLGNLGKARSQSGTTDSPRTGLRLAAGSSGAAPWKWRLTWNQPLDSIYRTRYSVEQRIEGFRPVMNDRISPKPWSTLLPYQYLDNSGIQFIFLRANKGRIHRWIFRHTINQLTSLCLSKNRIKWNLAGLKLSDDI